ncbi:MAG TPA: hypothetical protein VHY34_00015 [Caulobacteraceae bacterium]|jgi:hypothetical protein|nr:hypothetical protein [Caulobacteraceae bacterium]
MTLGISSSTLLSYYQLKAGVPVTASNTASGSTTKTNPTPPWLSTSTPTSAQTNALVTAAIDGAQIINPGSVKLDVPGASANYKKLFALYQGLSTLKDIAAQAGQTGQSTGQLAQLQKAFASGLSQVQTYLAGSPFNGFTVNQGSDSNQQTTTAGVLKETNVYSTGTISTGSVDDVDPALQGNISFSAQVTKAGGAQVTVNFNLDDMGSTPRSVGNVVNYLNAQLQAAGVVTSFKVVDTPATPQTVQVSGKTVTLPAGPDQLSLQIQGTSAEQVSFSAPTQSPAIYLVQTAGIAPATSTGTTGSASSPTSSSSSSASASSPDVSQQLLKLDPSAANPRTFTDSLGNQVTNVTATATAPDGSVYVLGDINGPTTAGETDASQKIAGTQDVALLHYDSAGNLLNTNVLGAANSASGLALAVSADGSQIAVAGTVTGALDGTTTPSSAATPTSFVSVFDNQGNPVWTARQNAAEGDQVNSVAFGADGSVYVGGTTQSSLTTNQLAGLSAGYVTGYSSTGLQTFTTQLGTTGVNSVTGIAVDGSQLVTVGAQNGDAVVNSFNIPTSGGAAVLTATRDLGALQGGSVAGVSINSDGSVIVAGATHNGALNAGTVTTAYSGGQEAFIARLTNADLTPSSSDTLTYYKGSGDTSASAVTVSGGQVYLTGQIAVPPTGGTGLTSAYDGYVAQIDPTTGAVGWSNIITGPNNEAAPHGIAVDATGSSVLDALGLPQGTINYTPNANVVANSGVTAGDQFTVTAFGVARTITIAADDTLQTLASKIQAASSLQATVKVVVNKGVQELQLTPTNAGASLSLGAGPNGKNALPGLGLTAGLVTNTTTIKSKTSTVQTSYGLNLPSTLNLSSAAGISAAQAALTSAMGTVARIYLNLTTPPSTPTTGAGSTSGKVPAYLTTEIASYQSALARLTASSGTTATSVASLF